MANKIEQLLSVLIAPAQAIEDTAQQMLTERYVDTAVGAQLDIIGRIVGQDRDGLVDDDYRRFIRARIAANDSDGTIEDLILISFLIVYDGNVTYTVDNQGVAGVMMRLTGAAVADVNADILIKFLDRAVSGGVRVVLEYSDQPPSTWFRWDVGPGWDAGVLVTDTDA